MATDSLQSAVRSACEESSHLCSAWITSCKPGMLSHVGGLDGICSTSTARCTIHTHTSAPALLPSFGWCAQPAGCRVVAPLSCQPCHLHQLSAASCWNEALSLLQTILRPLQYHLECCDSATPAGLDTTDPPPCRIDLLPASSTAGDASRHAPQQAHCRAAGSSSSDDGQDLHVVLSLAPAYHLDHSEAYSSLAVSLQDHLTAAGLKVSS